MNPVPLPTRVFLACGMTDMRKGFDGLAVLVQQVLREDLRPLSVVWRPQIMLLAQLADLPAASSSRA